MKTLREMMDLIESAQTPVAEGTEQQYRIYFVIPEHEDYDDRHEPTETTIVTASSANEAGKKFKLEVPEAYIEQIVPLNYNKGVAEAMSKNDLITNLSKDLEKVRKSKHRGDPNAWAKGDLYTGARDQEDIDSMSRRDTSEPRPSAKQRAKDLSARAKRNSSVEEDQATAQMGLMSAMGSNSGAPDRQRMAQQAVERLAQER